MFPTVMKCVVSDWSDGQCCGGQDTDHLTEQRLPSVSEPRVKQMRLMERSVWLNQVL